MPLDYVITIRPLTRGIIGAGGGYLYNAESLDRLENFLENRLNAQANIQGNTNFLLITSEHFLSNGGTSYSARALQRNDILDDEFILYRDKLKKLSRSYPNACFVVNSYTILPMQRDGVWHQDPVGEDFVAQTKASWANTAGFQKLLNPQAPHLGIGVYVNPRLNQYNNALQTQKTCNVSMFVKNDLVQYNLKTFKYGNYDDNANIIDPEWKGDILNLRAAVAPVFYMNGYAKNTMSVSGNNYIHFICYDVHQMWDFNKLNNVVTTAAQLAQMPIIVQGDCMPPSLAFDSWYKAQNQPSFRALGGITIHNSYPDTILPNAAQIAANPNIHHVLTNVPCIIFADNTDIKTNLAGNAKKVGAIYKWIVANNRFERIDTQLPAYVGAPAHREIESGTYAYQPYCYGAQDQFYYSIYDMRP